MAEGPVGRSITRLEDERLLRGEGRYLDDLPVVDELAVAMVRSPHAHARIGVVDASLARQSSGVVAVVDGTDVTETLPPLVSDIGEGVPEPVQRAVNPLVRSQAMPVLASNRVLYVGQPVAAVVAEDRYQAEDAAERVTIDYDLLPSVIDPEAALGPEAPLLEPDWKDNLAVSFRGCKGDPERAFTDPFTVVEESIRSHRHMAAPIETRGVLSMLEPSGGLMVWSSTQVPFLLRDLLAELLALPRRAVRVIAPEVGGAFGLKGSIYPEEVLVPLLALKLERPVKWVEDRAEHLVASTHGREQVHQIALAATEHGRIIGLRDRIIINAGAYSRFGIVVPYNTFTHLVGPYDIEHVDVDVKAVLTNTGITAPYRGTGRPEAVFALERIIDRLALQLDADPADLRERNLIPARRMPYKTGFVYRDGTAQVYDSGDYPELLRRTRRLVDERRWREKQSHGANGNHCVGIGFAGYVEGTGLGPFEAAEVGVDSSGTIRVETGTSSQGQGHGTTLTQIAADVLDVAVESVEVVGGDTGRLAYGFGTIASRTLVVGGTAVLRASERVREHIRRLAAQELEIAPADIELVNGTAQPRGHPAAGIKLGELVAQLVPWNPDRPAEEPAELRESAIYRPPTVVHAAGVHAAVVRVDIETGGVELVRYVVSHDAGRIVNPLIADGQSIGGVVQGIGGALYEALIYDEDGQLRSANFMDYLLPTAGEVPEILVDHLETPTSHNPLGAKGLGEGGAVGPVAAIGNAVEDALKPYGVVIRECPLSPSRVRALIRKAPAKPAQAD